MILIISSPTDGHVDLVTPELRARNGRFVRIHPEEFPSCLNVTIKFQAGQLQGELLLPSGEQVMLGDIKAVWYRKPRPPLVDPRLTGAARGFAEREWACMIEGLWGVLNCFWMNHPIYNRWASCKPFQWLVASELGFELPATVLTNTPAEARAFLSMHTDTIHKVIDQTVVEVDNQEYAMYTRRVDQDSLRHLDAIRFTPCIFQEYVPKEVEIRVTVVQNQVFACEIHSQNSTRTKYDWRRYDFPNVPHQVHKLPEEEANRCRALLRRLNLTFGAIDLIKRPDGKYVFLEINPNGQWGWVQQLTAMPIAAAIAEALLT